MAIEIVYRWPDGHEEVHYRREGADAWDIIGELIQLKRKAAKGGWKCPYYARKVSRPRPNR